MAKLQRDLLAQLAAWKEHPLRKPLILRGARQVGKSWLIREFGKQFRNFVEINFEKDRKAIRLFQGDLHVDRLLENIALYTNKSITLGDTLLFLDEIQECEQAITVLRYFKEDMPNLHVIATGSLIDFALENLGMPVGRVQFMYLHPLSFGEFLTAMNRDDLRKHIFSLDVSPVINEKILELLKNYMWLGGMPNVISTWLEHKSATFCQEVQDEIIVSYIQDFHKYARLRQISHVTQVFESIPAQLGNKFKYINIDKETRSYLFKESLLLLKKAGIAHICRHSSGQKIPLGAEANEKKFKVYFLDIGLTQRMLGLTINRWVTAPMVHGPITEQLIAQEIIAYTNIKSPVNLYYWHKKAKSSNAEVDFLLVKNGDIVPVEVKSGATGSMKSMHSFLATHKNSPYGIKISTNIFSINGNIEEIPLYAIEAWLK